MKANAPERIYCESDGLGNIDRAHNIKWPDDEAENIEYIRTDAFIEKAKKWFEKQNEWRDMNGIKHCDMESFEDFVNYMKGE